MTQAPHRILIVDDDPALLELLEDVEGQRLGDDDIPISPGRIRVWF